MDVSVNRIVDQDALLKVWLSDKELFFNQLKNRDISAFKLLYQQYAAAIYGAIIRKVSDEHVAKLLLEQTFCEVWQSFPEYNQTKSSIFTWIHQIASRKIKKTT